MTTNLHIVKQDNREHLKRVNLSKIATHSVYALTTLSISRLALHVPIHNMKTRVQINEVSDVDLARSMIINTDDSNDEQSNVVPTWNYGAMKENLAVYMGDEIASLLVRRFVTNISPLSDVLYLSMTYPLHLIYLRQISSQSAAKNRRVVQTELSWSNLLLNRSLPLALLHKAAVSSIAVYILQPAMKDLLVDKGIVSRTDKNLLDVSANTLAYLISKIIFSPLEVLYKRKAADSVRVSRHKRASHSSELIHTSLQSALLTIPEELLNLVQFFIYRIMSRLF